MMADEGEITEVDMSGTHSRFDARRGNHYHFRCQICDAVCDVEEPVHRELDKKAEATTGFSIFQHVLEFRGTCSDCKS
jgi:Fe2+ or Zn2+ uptake regulation protein